MAEQTSLRCPQFAWQQMFTTHSCRLKHIKLHRPEHVQVAQQKNLNIWSMPRRIEPAQHHQFNADQDSVEDLDACPCLDYIENIADSEFQPPPPPPHPLPQIQIDLGAGAPLTDYITKRW
jgi:hypothetical protein